MFYFYSIIYASRDNFFSTDPNDVLLLLLLLLKLKTVVLLLFFLKFNRTMFIKKKCNIVKVFNVTFVLINLTHPE